MGILDSILGVSKLVSNVVGGGAGKSQTGTTATQGNSTSNQSQSQQQVGSSATSSGTQGDTSQTQTQQSSQNQTQTGQQFSASFLKMLEGITSGALGQGATATSQLAGQLTKDANTTVAFDPQKYISDVVTGASDTINRGVNSGVNQTQEQTGGSTSGNSQAALLAGNLRAQGAAQIAGIQGDAELKAVSTQDSLATNKDTRLVGLNSSIQSTLSSMLAALKGGSTTQSLAGTSAVNSSGQTTSNSVTNSNTATNTTTGTSSQDVTNTSQNGKSSAQTPFNWASGFGDLFKGLDTSA